jgi:hypothetical protein
MSEKLAGTCSLEANNKSLAGTSWSTIGTDGYGYSNIKNLKIYLY